MSNLVFPSIVPVVLCGGSGTRLWPLSTPARPKQMLKMFGSDTMLQATVRRVEASPLFRPAIIVASEDQANGICRDVPNVSRLILEPAPRNTAPAVALASLEVLNSDLILVLPSDHVIGDELAFFNAVERAIPLAQQGRLVTFGANPTRPETGYGYIERGSEIGQGVFEVVRFIEKPPLALVSEFLQAGTHFWNCGIFLFRASALLHALEQHAPAVLSSAIDAVRNARRNDKRVYPDRVSFVSSPALSIDKAVMEKEANLAVVSVDMKWSDVGSWESLYEMTSQDDSGNAILGDVMALDCQGCLIRTDGPMIAAIGVSDLVIVSTGNTILIVPREASQRVGELLEKIKPASRS